MHMNPILVGFYFLPVQKDKVCTWILAGPSGWGVQLEIEKEAIKREKDASKLGAIEKELAELIMKIAMKMKYCKYFRLQDLTDHRWSLTSTAPRRFCEFYNLGVIFNGLFSIRLFKG